MSTTILTAETDRATSADVAIADPTATAALAGEQGCEAACPANEQPSAAGVALAGEQGCEAACPANEQPSAAGEEAIRELAHRKWEAAGCPAGNELDFWLEAEREVNAERSEPSPAQG